jgi:hypothetical protein
MTLTSFTESLSQPQILELTFDELADLHGGRGALLKRIAEGVATNGIYDVFRAFSDRWGWSSGGSVPVPDLCPLQYCAA